jgi:hypothetical protein
MLNPEDREVFHLDNPVQAATPSVGEGAAQLGVVDAIHNPQPRSGLNLSTHKYRYFKKNIYICSQKKFIQ